MIRAVPSHHLSLDSCPPPPISCARPPQHRTSCSTGGDKQGAGLAPAESTCGDERDAGPAVANGGVPYWLACIVASLGFPPVSRPCRPSGLGRPSPLHFCGSSARLFGCFLRRGRRGLVDVCVRLHPDLSLMSTSCLNELHPPFFYGHFSYVLHAHSLSFHFSAFCSLHFNGYAIFYI